MPNEVVDLIINIAYLRIIIIIIQVDIDCVRVDGPRTCVFMFVRWRVEGEWEG
jgi:hypothetical protein